MHCKFYNKGKQSWKNWANKLPGVTSSKNVWLVSCQVTDITMSPIRDLTYTSYNEYPHSVVLIWMSYKLTLPAFTQQLHREIPMSDRPTELEPLCLSQQNRPVWSWTVIPPKTLLPPQSDTFDWDHKTLLLFCVLTLKTPRVGFLSYFFGIVCYFDRDLTEWRTKSLQTMAHLLKGITCIKMSLGDMLLTD